MKVNKRKVSIAHKGKVFRVQRDYADTLVSGGKARYISKSKYKHALGLKLTPAQTEDLKHTP